MSEPALARQVERPHRVCRLAAQKYLLALEFRKQARVEQSP